MISKKKIVSLLMAACIFAGAPQMPAKATEAVGDKKTSTSIAENSLAEYDENDLAVINRIITENGLGEQGYQENEPWDWDFMEWGDTEPKKVDTLGLDSMGLSGKLDVSGLSNLWYLDCGSNNLSDLDVSGLSSLRYLLCYRNNLSNLNVSGLTNLESLSCGNSNLSNLDLSGLSNLEELFCYSNNLSDLDVSSLTNLENLNCASNNLRDLDVSDLTKLWYLDCESNNLSDLDVSSLSSLMYLYCYSNNLSNLDVSGLNNLENLSCGSNNLSDLDVSGLNNLRYLSCYSNNLSNLDVNGTANLESLACYSNSLSDLDVSGLINLEGLSCYSNNLSDLDVSGLSSLKYLYCYINPIKKLTMPNGKILTINDSSTAKGDLAGGIAVLSGGHNLLETIRLKADAYEGYQFQNWDIEGITLSESDMASSTIEFKMTENDVTVTPIFTENETESSTTYKITYQLNGGTQNNSNSNTYTAASALVLYAPTKTGYTFDGWYKESNFKNKISAIIKGSTGSITLYAKWTANKYTVTFDKNKGSNLSKRNITVAYANTYGTLPTVQRKNYIFKGWYTQKSGGTKITSKTNVSITKTQTLYAQWTAVTKPGKATISSAKNNKAKQMNIKLKKVNGADGYEIFYSTNSKFKSATKITATSLSRTISKLTKGKTYYVRVRAYKLDSAQNKVYGSYSAVNKITIRK